MATEPDAIPEGFGDLLRQYRLSANLTQDELAEKAGMSKRGISDLERGARSRPQRATLRLLVEALDLSGLKRADFVAAARRPPLPRRATPVTADVPNTIAQPPAPLDVLIGRKQIIVEVAALLRRDETRLVTLNGPGGVGKTRVALAAAAEVGRDFADGVAFVDLAPIRDPALVLSTIADRLGVRESSGPLQVARLRDFLSARHMLLLLDNFEHVVEAAPSLAGLLSGAPNLTILATSRVPLRIAGEYVSNVPPLSLPEPAATASWERVHGSEAVRLFVARAKAADAAFTLGSGNAASVAEICIRLDGLPLAIELAAARTALLPPETMLSRLEPRLPMLTGGRRDAPTRQQTMTATIEWSYGLLGPAEQRLFRWLAVFVGGWTLDAAEAVMRDGHPCVLEGLATLTEAHLVTRQTGTGFGVRFGMLETMREFALDKLTANGEESAVRDRHAMHFVEQVEAAGPWLEDNRGGPWRTGAGIDEWLDQLTVEFPNVRAAADWAVRHGHGEVLLRLGCAIYPFFNTYSLGDSREGRRWLESGLAAGAGPDESLRIWALGFASTLATVDGDHERAVSLAQQGLVLARENENQRGEAEALDSLGFSAMLQGDLHAAEAYYTALLEILRGRNGRGESRALDAFSGGRPADDPEWVAHTFDSLAHIALAQGDRKLAAQLAGQAQAMLPVEGCSAHHARLFGTLGAIALAEGDDGRAVRFWQESLQQWKSLRNRRGVADCLAGLATVLSARGTPEAAAYLLGAADTLLEEVGARHLIHAVALDHVLETTRISLGAGSKAAWEQGQAQPMEEVVSNAFALVEDLPTTER